MLELDSPEVSQQRTPAIIISANSSFHQQQEPVDDIEDIDSSDALFLPPSSSQPQATGGKLLSQRPKEKPREEQLEYPLALPYECEGVEEMDARLDVILRRLVDCVRGKD